MAPRIGTLYTRRMSPPPVPTVVDLVVLILEQSIATGTAPGAVGTVDGAAVSAEEMIALLRDGHPAALQWATDVATAALRLAVRRTVAP